jgi:hypothetical protein
VFGGNSVFRSGAARSMKMGNIASPWRYDKSAHCAMTKAPIARSIVKTAKARDVVLRRMAFDHPGVALVRADERPG